MNHPIKIIFAAVTTAVLLAFLSSCRSSSSTLKPTSSLNESLQLTPTVTLSLPEKQSTIIPRPTITPRTPKILTLTPTLQQEIFTIPTPTYTPTINTANIITRTPAPPAQCPIEKPGLSFNPQFESPFCLDVNSQVIDYLNDGGQLQAVADRLNTEIIDLTGDNVPELTVSGCSFQIYSCNEGQYVMPLDYGRYDLRILAIKDMNLDGIPELIISQNDFPTDYMYYTIFEWDGQQFQNLIKQPDFYSRYDGGRVEDNSIVSTGIGRGLDNILENWSLEDIDGNGTIEFVINCGLPTHVDGKLNGPWRAETDTYMWNGYGFVLHSIQVEPPQYRFQAVQDADYALEDGDYEKALDLYEQVIYNDKLGWWSNKRNEHEQQIIMSDISGLPTPTPLPQDFTEYNNLAAYAHYRIMLLYVLQGRMIEAYTIYDSLQEKYPSWQVGNAYAELAKVFWEEYKTSQKIGLACSKAIEYTAIHPKEILTYIGDFFSEFSIKNHNEGIIHGWQSKTYHPEDICLFK